MAEQLVQLSPAADVLAQAAEPVFSQNGLQPINGHIARQKLLRQAAQHVYLLNPALQLPGLLRFCRQFVAGCPNECDRVRRSAGIQQLLVIRLRPGLRQRRSADVHVHRILELGRVVLAGSRQLFTEVFDLGGLLLIRHRLLYWLGFGLLGLGCLWLRGLGLLVVEDPRTRLLH